MFASVIGPLRLTQRRTFGLADPALQLRLALTVLGISFLFLCLVALNSYSAYAPMLSTAVGASPEVWADDLVGQTRYYVVVSFALITGYALAMIGASIAFVHRVAGPMVALRRHARDLNAGRYTSRIKLRGGSRMHAELAEQLNELAAELQHAQDKQRAA